MIDLHNHSNFSDGFYEPTKGEILINGKPKNFYTQKEYIENITEYTDKAIYDVFVTAKQD